MSYIQEYQSKIRSADEAVKVVKSGDVVHYSEFAMASHILDEALAKRRDELNDVVIRTVSNYFPPKTIVSDPEKKHFILHESHMSAATRKLHDKDMGYHLPISYSECGSYYDRGQIPVDVALLRVGPMDKHGFFNLGVSNSVTPNVIAVAKTIIVEVNESVPRCLGGNKEAVHISKVDFIVEGDNKPLIEVPPAPVSNEDRIIAELIMKEIEDGACLQLGIGGMPNTIGSLIAESDLKDLGIHTEMLVDSMVDMYEAGRVTGMRKTLDPGKMVYTFAMGRQRLYDFLDDNPTCASCPADYTNDPYVISQNDKVVSINNALEIDLYGQICSESSGTRQISGTGGQFDFHYGSFRSKGGKGFLCLSSTTTGKNGELLSRIKPIITPGGIVTMPRSLVFYIVTEYGMTKMIKGLSNWERAEEIINVAHPDFRDDLIKEAQQNKIWRRSNKLA
jgi:Acetyl-CoA hydrolase